MAERERKTLGFIDCMGIGIGQIIGSGVMVLTGIVVGLTGHGTPLAFILAAVAVIATMVPTVVLSSSIPSNGGGYYYVKTLIGEKIGFVYLGMFVITQVLIATFALGFASYLAAIIPSVNQTLAAVGILALATIINIIGLKTAASVQNIMVALLLVSLGLFVIFGLPKVTWSELTFSSANLMPNGVKNFLVGIALLSFATGGAKFLAETGGEVRNPGKTLPLAMIISTALVAIFYALIGVVACGVLPLEQVAFQNLTLVAQTIFPPWLFFFFIIGGALFALATTLNGTLSWVTRGLQLSAKEGWLPEVFAKENKGGAPVLLLILFFVVGALPIVTGMDTTMIASMGIGLNMVCVIMEIIACWRLPKLKPAEFEAAVVKPKKSVLYVLLVLAIAIAFGTFLVSLADLTLKVWLAIIIWVALVGIYTYFKGKQRDNAVLAGE